MISRCYVLHLNLADFLLQQCEMLFWSRCRGVFLGMLERRLVGDWVWHGVSSVSLVPAMNGCWALAEASSLFGCILPVDDE